MQFRRPQSLNGLILVGFGLVGLPLLIAVVWALINLDRLADQSEKLVFTGVAAAENNRRLTEQVLTLQRVTSHHQVLLNADSLQLMHQDLATFQATLDEMRPLTELAGATPLLQTISSSSRRIIVDRRLAGFEQRPGTGGDGPLRTVTRPHNRVDYRAYRACRQHGC